MRVLVTGGGGFLGGAIVRKLVERGATVRSLARGDYPALRALGVETIRGDLSDPEAVRRAASGSEVVYHVAAKAGIWGPEAEFQRANVEGTAQILAACRSEGVGRLVYTSTPSVVHQGGDLEGVDESAPYAEHPEAAYPRTKIAAERLVLAANGPNLATVALRPHLIWGPGDHHLIPRIVARARAGRLFRIGRRPCVVDTTYVDNAADAHLLAADCLAPGAPVAGRPYFIAQGEPVALWDFLNRILALVGLPPVGRSVPFSVAYAAGASLEALYRASRRHDEPPMTRFLACQLATSHWFDLTAARRDLGYAPAVSVEEGLVRLGIWLREPTRAT